jgi:hypothetical protein
VFVVPLVNKKQLNITCVKLICKLMYNFWAQTVQLSSLLLTMKFTLVYRHD